MRLICGSLLAIASQVHSSEGLWVGDVIVDAVSEVNKPRSDLSFDLQLEGTLLEEGLIEEESTWRYDSGVDHGVAWRELSFDDSTWNSGAGALGYGANQAVTTEVDFGADANNKYPTTYFRQSFEVADASIYTTLLLRYRRDDGIAIYINGGLLLKDNLPTSLTEYSTLALTSVNSDETAYQELAIPPGALVNGTNLVAVEIHIASVDDEDMGFDLSLAAQREAVTSILISSRDSDWRYYDSGDELPLEWRNLVYDEPGWKTGVAPLGYGDGDEQTEILSGTSEAKNPVSYFRKSFDVTDKSSFSHLNVLLLRDDGAVVYLNGEEIMRSNMPDGEILYTSLPIEGVGADDENRFYQQLIPSGLLVNGNNVIAVEVHQHAAELTPFDGTAPPSPVAAPLGLRMLLHEDSGGQVRLLKQVILMWEDGSSNPDGTLAEQGRYVLLTDDTLIPNYKGIGVRGSSLVGRRISAVGFDFPNNEIDLSGTLDPEQIVTGSFVLPGDHPTHSRRHRYHPEHDNMNAIYSAAADEVAAIERTITLQFMNRYPPDPNAPETLPPPGWNETRLGGIYQEVITGLHRDPIEVKGVFTLDIASDTGLLNE